MADTTYPASTAAPRKRWLARLGGVIDRFGTWVGLLLSVGATLLVYGPTLRFSYFFDDTFDLTRAEGRRMLELLGPMPDYSYYRPLLYLVWNALHELTGRHDPVLLHAIPVAAHAFAGWFLFLLVRRLTTSWWSLIAALLFIVYPFSYQAVEIVAAYHPVVTAGLLATLILWYDGRVGGSPRHLMAACVVAVLTLWTHEFGTTVLPLLAALEAFLWLRGRIGRPSAWLLGPAVAEVAFLGVWLTIDKPPSLENPTLVDVGKNVRFWLQGLAYPATRQADWLANAVGTDPARIVPPLAAATLVLAGGAYLRGRQALLALATLGWAGLVFLPAAVTLTSTYMEDSPRLLYVVAPGCAAFWGLLPGLRFRSARTTAIWQAGTLALVALIVVQSVAFIQVRTRMLEHGTDLVEGVIQIGARHDGGAVLFLNVPSWFALDKYEYPFGHLGVTVIPSYVGLDRVIYTGTGAQVQVESRSLAPDVAGWRYAFQPHGAPIDHVEVDALLRRDVALAVADLFRSGLEVREPGTLRPDQPAPKSHLAMFGDALQLVDAGVARDGRRVTVTTHWYVAQPLEADHQLWVQLRDPHGALLAERKDYALRGMSPPRLWQPGDAVEDRLVLELPDGVEPEDVTARLALVRTEDRSLRPAVAEDGHSAGGGWVELGSAS